MGRRGLGQRYSGGYSGGYIPENEDVEEKMLPKKSKVSKKLPAPEKNPKLKPVDPYEILRSQMFTLAAEEISEPLPVSPMVKPEPQLPQKPTRNINLYYTDSSKNSDKVYCVEIVSGLHRAIGGYEYYVKFKYGKRGGTLREGTKTVNPVDGDEALYIFNKLVSAKKQEGYTENISGRPYSR